MKLKMKWLLLLMLALSWQSGYPKQQNKQDKPKLVVGIIIDQMRWDYLHRYQKHFGKGGFRRLMNEGFSFDNCFLPYIPSYTAIGHTTVYTGSVPSIHGICGNSFIVQQTGKRMYCTSDSTVQGVGIDPKHWAGKMSPRNMHVTTVGDQLRYATNFRSKVVGIALKDRGSILPAGHAATAAYWYEAKTGKWITSTYYTNALPQWLINYNDANMPEKYLRQDWNASLPLDAYTESPHISKLGRYEEPLSKDVPITFPMKTSELMKTLGIEILPNTPYGDRTTADVAKLAIQHERLGNNPSGDTDFLAVSFSSPDKMGHQYTTNSILMEDAYIKLDETLSDFFSYLDKAVGKDKYLLFLTADHAGTPNAQYMNDNKLPGDTWNYITALRTANAELGKKYGRTDLIRSFENYQAHLNYPVIESQGINLEQLKMDIIRMLENMDGILYAVDMKRSEQSTVPQSIREMIVNGYNHRYSGEIQLVLKPGYYSMGSRLGGTHGTWAPDDTHIPLLMMGWGVPRGNTSQKVSMADIAPTIASMLRIQMPNGSIGQPLDYLFPRK